MEMNEVSETAQNSLKSFLSNKPMWAFWISYTVLSGILFSIFYATMYLVAQAWWIPVVVIIIIGMIWGTLAYPNIPKVENPEIKKEA